MSMSQADYWKHRAESAESQLAECVALLRRCSSVAYDNAQGRIDAGWWLYKNFPVNAREPQEEPR